MSKISIDIKEISKNKDFSKHINLLERAAKELENIYGRETSLTKEIRMFLEKNKNYEIKTLSNEDKAIIIKNI